MFLSKGFFYLFFYLQLALAANTETYIETSSLLTCMTNSQLTASYFNVVYTPNNTKVTFDISAITTITGKVTAKVQVIVYGLNILEKSVSLCDLGFPTLCPLTAGRLDVDSSYDIGSTYSKQIPGIAFSIPDLDAKVKVEVFSSDSSNGSAVACVEAILTNGKTVQTKYASWPIAAISGLGLITSGVVSVTGHSSTAAHIASNSLSLFVYFQNLAISSMMGVNTVPPIAAAWCQNFQWSMGIIHLDVLTKISNWYVQATGGTATSVIANKNLLSIAVQKKLIKRTTYGTLKYLSDLHQQAQTSGYLLTTPISRKSINKNVLLAKRDGVASATEDNLNDESLYNTDEKNTTALTTRILVLRGIQRVSYLASIEITSLFFTSLAFTIFFAFVLVISLTIFKAIIELLIKIKAMNEGKFGEYRSQWKSVIKGSMYRLFLIGLPQVVVMCLWELTERDSVGCVVLAVVVFLLIMGILIQASIKLFLIGHESVQLYKNPAYSLYGDPKVLNKYGFLYVQYSAGCYYWIMISLSYIIIRSLVIAVLQKYGKVQAVIIFVIELVYLIALCAIRPYMDRRTNVFNILIHVVNLINSVFFLIFSQIFSSSAPVISIAGVVLFVVNAVFSLILLVFTIVTCAMAIIYKNPDAKYTPVNDDRVCFIKRTDGEEKLRGGTELDALGSAALKDQPDVDITKTLSHQYTPGGTKLGNGFIDDDYEETYPSNKLANNNVYTQGHVRSNSMDNVVEPDSMIYGVSKPSNVHNQSKSNLAYQGMSINTLSSNVYGATNNSYPYDQTGSSTNLTNPYGKTNPYGNSNNQGHGGFY